MELSIVRSTNWAQCCQRIPKIYLDYFFLKMARQSISGERCTDWNMERISPNELTVYFKNNLVYIYRLILKIVLKISAWRAFDSKIWSFIIEFYIHMYRKICVYNFNIYFVNRRYILDSKISCRSFSMVMTSCLYSSCSEHTLLLTMLAIWL